MTLSSEATSEQTRRLTGPQRVALYSGAGIALAAMATLGGASEAHAFSTPSPIDTGGSAAPAKKAPAKKSPAKKSSAKKSTPAKSSAKKSTPAKSSAKKSTPAKPSAKKSTPQKTGAVHVAKDGKSISVGNRRATPDITDGGSGSRRATTGSATKSAPKQSTGRPKASSTSTKTAKAKRPVATSATTKATPKKTTTAKRPVTTTKAKPHRNPDGSYQVGSRRLSADVPEGGGRTTSAPKKKTTPTKAAPTKATSKKTTNRTTAPTVRVAKDGRSITAGKLRGAPEGDPSNSSLDIKGLTPAQRVAKAKANRAEAQRIRTQAAASQRATSRQRSAASERFLEQFPALGDVLKPKPTPRIVNKGEAVQVGKRLAHPESADSRVTSSQSHKTRHELHQEHVRHVEAQKQQTKRRAATRSAQRVNVVRAGNRVGSIDGTDTPPVEKRLGTWKDEPRRAAAGKKVDPRSPLAQSYYAAAHKRAAEIADYMAPSKGLVRTQDEEEQRQIAYERAIALVDRDLQRSAKRGSSADKAVAQLSAQRQAAMRKANYAASPMAARDTTKTSLKEAEALVAKTRNRPGGPDRDAVAEANRLRLLLAKQEQDVKDYTARHRDDATMSPKELQQRRQRQRDAKAVDRPALFDTLRAPTASEKFDAERKQARTTKSHCVNVLTPGPWVATGVTVRACDTLGGDNLTFGFGAGGGWEGKWSLDKPYEPGLGLTMRGKGKPGSVQLVVQSNGKTTLQGQSDALDAMALTAHGVPPEVAQRLTTGVFKEKLVNVMPIGSGPASATVDPDGSVTFTYRPESKVKVKPLDKAADSLATGAKRVLRGAGLDISGGEEVSVKIDRQGRVSNVTDHSASVGVATPANHFVGFTGTVDQTDEDVRLDCLSRRYGSAAESCERQFQQSETARRTAELEAAEKAARGTIDGAAQRRWAKQHAGQQAPSSDRMLLDEMARQSGVDPESAAYKSGGFVDFARRMKVNDRRIAAMRSEAGLPASR